MNLLTIGSIERSVEGNDLGTHDGKPLEEVKPKFEKLFGGVSAREIADLEQKSSWKGCQLKRYNAYAMFMLRYSRFYRGYT